MENTVNTTAFVEYVVRGLITSPDSARVEPREVNGVSVQEIFVDDDDIPRLIGHGGSTISAIRALATAAGLMRGEKIGVEIIE
jgi:uncharacterized protein